MALDWIPLTDYSTKYKVSISTLRRRIKTDEIKYMFEEGKYLIFDEPISAHQSLGRPSRPSLMAQSPSPERDSRALMSAQVSALGASIARDFSSGFGSPNPRTKSEERATKRTEVASSLEQIQTQSDEPILTAANKLLNELKRAYTQILQEKEEQILQLNAEISDLKTLVRVLESENERLEGY